MLTAFARRTAESAQFQSFILGLIFLCAVAMGLETVPRIAEEYGDYFWLFFIGSQAIFIFEIAVRILAFAPRIGEFFLDRWNTFDFAIVVLSLLPVAGPLALIGRFARLLRVARVFSSSRILRRFIAGIGDSLAVSCAGLFVLAFVFYIFTVAGVYLFGETAPATWGSFGLAASQLLEFWSWRGIGDFVAAGAPTRVLFPILFWIATVLIVLNWIAATVRVHLDTHADGAEGD